MSDQPPLPFDHCNSCAYPAHCWAHRECAKSDLPRPTPRTSALAAKYIASPHTAIEANEIWVLAETLESESDARAERIAELEEIGGGFEAEMAKFEHLANESLALCEKAQAENAKLREALGELDKLKPDFTSPEVYYWAVKDIISQALAGKDGGP